jgi:hypothetical protein
LILRPYYPISKLFRVIRNNDQLQLDFMGAIDGIRSFEGLRSRAVPLHLSGRRLLVASLADIIKSKRAADRPSDRAILPVLERALEEEKARQAGAEGDADGT